jgi:integrase
LKTKGLHFFAGGGNIFDWIAGDGFSPAFPQWRLGMAQTKRSAKLDTRTARRKIWLGSEKQTRIAPGQYIIYKRPKDGASGKWLAQWYNRLSKKKIKQFLGVADDYQDANGTTIFSYAQAQAEANRWFLLQERMALHLDADPSCFAYTVAHAIDDYFLERDRQSAARAKKDKAAAAMAIVPALGGIEVASLTQKRIELWLHELAESPRRLRSKPGGPQAFAALPATDDEKRARKDSANRILTILKAALNFVYKRKLAGVVDPCWQRVEAFKRTAKARIRFLKPEEQVALVRVCPPDFGALVRAALLTGCRYGELARLRCRDYDPNPSNPTIFVAESKSGKTRHVYLSNEGNLLFDELTAGLEFEALIFLKGADRRRTRKYLGRQWGTDDQLPCMKAACRAAGFKITFHELRHTYASTLVNSGCPLQVVAHQLGHSNTKMAEKHYGHLAPSYIAQAVRAAMPPLRILGMGRAKAKP